jgi:hypothetical protein
MLDIGPTGQPRPVLSKTDARAGKTGQGVRYVLIFSLIGVVVMFAIIYFLISHHG